MERPDEFLATASRRGDRDAYAELVHRHLKRVFAICLGVLGDPAEAEDATQEVFVRGFEQIGTLRDGGRFASWIGQIARNRCRDLLRRRVRRAECSLTRDIADQAPAPADEFPELRLALFRLPEEHRLPLLLYYYDGKSVKALAREMGLTEGGACTRLFRARRRLRSLLEEEASPHE